MKPYTPVFLIICSAVLLALSFPMANLWILSWVAFVPFLMAIKDKNFISVFLLGFLCGIVFFYTTINWLNSIAIMATIALVLYLALYFALFAGLAAVLLKKNLPIFLKCILVSSVWVVLEVIRSNLFTGFGWNLVGYSQASFLPAIQIADITGVWGVSFIVMFTNTAIYEFFAAPSLRAPRSGAKQSLCLLQNRLINFLLCIFLIMFIFIYGFYKLNTEIASSPLTSSMSRVPRNDDGVHIKISLIQGNIPQTLKWDESYKQNIIDTYFNLTRQAAAERPDLIIWPETAFPVDFGSEPQLANRLFDLAREVNAYLLVGANRFSGNKIYNSAFLVSPEGKIKQYYDKLHLVPFGEYMPKLPNFLYKIFPEKINMVGDFSPGEEYTVFNVGAGRDLPLHFSTLICFEDVFPELSHRFVKNGARLLVNITNDGWYGLSSAPFQHAQASVFRAVENRVSVVRAANTGYSVFIDESGRITGKIEPFTAGHRTEVCKIKS